MSAVVGTDLDAWWSGGAHVPLTVRGADGGPVDVDVFLWSGGDADAPVVTLLHGWPTSSWDWAPTAPVLARTRRVLAPDLLGLGASSKGDHVPYGYPAQADMLLALWDRLGVTSTAIVAHDVGTIVTQELLARRLDGGLDVDVTAVTWLNGSLDPSAYRPTAGQLALLDPDHGPALAALVDESTFTAGLAAVHARPVDAAVLRGHWRAMSRDDGHLGSPRFLRYIPERAAHADRLVGAFRATDVPMVCIWGVDDEVSGAPQLARIRELRPDVPVVALGATGHFPHTERPEAFLASWRATSRQVHDDS